jgi:hypothetical protein
MAAQSRHPAGSELGGVMISERTVVEALGVGVGDLVTLKRPAHAGRGGSGDGCWTAAAAWPCGARHRAAGSGNVTCHRGRGLRRLIQGGLRPPDVPGLPTTLAPASWDHRLVGTIDPGKTSISAPGWRDGYGLRGSPPRYREQRPRDSAGSRHHGPTCVRWAQGRRASSCSRPCDRGLRLRANDRA